VLSVYLLTLIHRYPLNRNCFRFHGYLWISVSKQTGRGREHHFRVFSSRDEFLVIPVLYVRTYYKWLKSKKRSILQHGRSTWIATQTALIKHFIKKSTLHIYKLQLKSWYIYGKWQTLRFYCSSRRYWLTCINSFSLSKVTILCYNLRNKQFVILMKISWNIALKILKKIDELIETFKHKIFNSHF